MARIVETDNYDGDYSYEKFLNIPSVEFEKAHKIACVINEAFPVSHNRYWKPVQDNYILKHGFEET